MVRLCLAGGRLIEKRLADAARLHESGDLQGAAVIYREIVKEVPRQHDALLRLGILAQQGSNAELALKFFELAIAAKPDFTNAWYNRALTLHGLKRGEEAMRSAEAALEVDPFLAEAWNLKALIAKDKHEYARARDYQERAISLRPNDPSFYDNLAAILMGLKQFSAAYLCSLRAIACDPSYVSLSFCITTSSLGYPAMSLDYFPRLHEHLPPAQRDHSKLTEAMTRLQIGDFEIGWDLWEHRTLFSTNLDAIPFWQGKKEQGGKINHLYLYEDQGIGDAIQFLRYVPLLREYAEHMTLCTRPSLQNLCAENFLSCDIMLETDDPPPATPGAARCRLTSVPLFVDKQLQNIPPAPYLTASEESRVFWRNKLRHLPSPRIGVVWAGGTKYKNDAIRSITFPIFRPVTTGHTAHFVSLQVGRAEDRDNDIFDAAPFLHDFADTAAAIAELDLVISVDTAVAHLAGALGKPTWVMLPFGSDWRWLLGREDSPWYAKARLFRQHYPEDWTGVIDRVRADCLRFINGDDSVLEPPQWQGGYLRQNPHALPLPL